MGRGGRMGLGLGAGVTRVVGPGLQLRVFLLLVWSSGSRDHGLCL